MLVSSLVLGYPVTDAECSAVMGEIQQDAPEECSPVQQGGECQQVEDTDQQLRGNLVEDLREVQVCYLWFQLSRVCQTGIRRDMN